MHRQPISSTSYISSIPYDPSDIHPLEDADAMLLQSVNADGNLFSVTGMVGWYDAAAEEFTPLSGDIFSLPLSDDAFHAYFWKPVFDGAASFRMQYDGADSSFNEYYQAALDQGLFEPPVRSFTSNLQGEVTSLYQEKRLNSASSATDSFSLELSAQEADLSNAPDIVLEPDAQPYNLGGWLANNTVCWSFEIPSDGYYNISLLYLDNDCVLFEFRMAEGGEDQQESYESLIPGVMIVGDDGMGLFESYPDAVNSFAVSFAPSEDGHQFTITHTGNLEILPDGIYTLVDDSLEVSDLSANEILGHLPTAATSLNANLGAYTVNYPEALISDWFYYVEAVFDDSGVALAEFIIVKDLSAVFRVDDDIEPVLIFGSAQPMMDAVTYEYQEDSDNNDADGDDSLGEMIYEAVPLVYVKIENGVALAAGVSSRLVVSQPWGISYYFPAVRSSDKAVASVDENGMITAHAVGETTISGTVAIEDGIKDFSIELSVRDEQVEVEETTSEEP